MNGSPAPFIPSFKCATSQSSTRKSLRLRIALAAVVFAALGGAFLARTIPAAAAAADGERIYALLETGLAAPPGQPGRHAFQPLGALPGARRLALGETGAHILALTEQGTVWALGENGAGQLGAGDTVSRGDWSQAGGLDEVLAIAAGDLHSAAVGGDGSLWTWGANYQGQLGDGTLVNNPSPARICGVSGAVAVAAGNGFTLAATADGTVWAFGSNWTGIAPGDGRRIIDWPVRVQGLSGIEAVAVLDNRGYARDAAGRIWAWGAASEPNAVAGPPEEIGANVSERMLAELSRRFGSLEHVLQIDADWYGNSRQARRVTVESATVSVDDAGAVTRHELEGAVLDASIGWAAVWITAPVGATDSSRSEDPSEITSEDLAGKLSEAEPTALALSGGPVFLSSFSGLTAAEQHGLVLQPDGTVCSWGRNDGGQLGDGTIVTRRTPVTAILPSGITQISTGYDDFGRGHGLAVRNDGTAWSWGWNVRGQLGDGTTLAKLIGIPVPGLAGVTAVAAGGVHSLALLNDGTVRAWGFNLSGRLGDGTTTQRTSPVTVIGLTGVVAISAGGSHSLALKGDGTVWGWGENGTGQLGDGTQTDRTSAVEVTGLTDVVAIAAGDNHSLALKSDGTVWGWGRDHFGQLGDGATGVNRTSPVRAGTLTGIIGIAGGLEHSLAVENDGTVWAWGLNGGGQLGDASKTTRSSPVEVSGLTNATQVAGGDDFSVARKADGSLWAWGNNALGQLGVGISPPESTVPVELSACASGVFPAAGKSPVMPRLAAAESHSMAVRSDGTVLAWGRNDAGQLGDGTTTSRSTPVQVIGVTGVKQVSTGSDGFGRGHGLAARADGTVWSWGRNANGQLGDGTVVSKPTPIQVPGLTGVTQVGAGAVHSLALIGDGTVRGWGSNSSGRLGDGTTTQRTTPVTVVGLTNVMAIAAGGLHSLALKWDGTVWGWGENGSGQLGDGTQTDRTTAVQVNGLANVIAIAAGNNHSLALKSDGTVWGWGRDHSGQLGDGDGGVNRVHPVRASDLTQVVGIAASEEHSLALRIDGTVWGWGLNSGGRLGDGSVLQRLLPVRTGELISFDGAVAIAAGGLHGFALRSDGTIWSWGTNDFGQFGIALPADSTIPVSAFTLQATPPLQDTTGVFRPSNGGLFLKSLNTAGFANRLLTFGLPGDKPVAGDWNGDGIDTVGVFRNAVFFLRNSNTNGFADLAFGYGAPTDLPVVGDWDGDGVDTIGVFRNGLFILRNSNTTGPAEAVFGLGVAGDIPISGDWDGDGVDTVGIFRPSNGALFLKNQNSTGFADIVLTFGLPGDKPVTGDWDGNGTDTIGVFRNGVFLLRNSNTNGFAEIVFGLGVAADEPISGIWGPL